MKKINWQDPTATIESSPKDWGTLFAHIGKVCISLFFLVVSIYLLLWPQVRVNYLFKPVTCVVLEKKIQHTLDEEGEGFQPVFLVLYRTENQTHIAWIYDILGMNMTNPAIRKDALKQFSSGYAYTCWYDPADPRIAVLKRGWNRMSLLFCGLALLVTMVTSVSFGRWIIGKIKSS